MIPFHPEATGPLDGLVVLDLSRLVAGNMLSLQLADYGAEVIKVEDPKKGDPLRDWRTQGLSVHWKVYGRNKKSLTLSLRSEEGKALFRQLLATADVMIENFRPGTLEEMGLGPDVLHAIRPGLVLVRVSGWGRMGPTASDRASARWSRACPALPPRTASPTGRRCCRRWPWPT